MDLMILGASARSAAFSGLRLGLRPACADLFADADLAAVAPARRVDPEAYPDGLLDFARSVEPTPWIYTGALENRPDLVDAIGRRHPLMGNPGEVLRRVRDPLALADVAHAAGFAAPEVRLDPIGLPRDGSWLRKPLASAGGTGIRPWLLDTPAPRRPAYYQRRIVGLPLASIHVAASGSARLMGITRQYLRHGFRYRGSLAPWPVPPETHRAIEALGRAIAHAFGLIGVFGIDLILRDGCPWPVEVNPRYTASVEALEWSLGRSILREHLVACGMDPPGPAMNDRAAPFVAKQVLFARRDGVWHRRVEPFDPRTCPALADIPHPGTRYLTGDPLATVFGRGESPRDALRDLSRNRRMTCG